MTCLSRRGTGDPTLNAFPVRIVQGDAGEVESLTAAYSGEEIVINISSIFHVPTILEAVQGSARRFIVVSSTGVFSKYRENAAEIARCEEMVRSSGIDYTILRPTMIYGTRDDRNISRLIELVRRHSILPIPRSNRHAFQPVHVDDLAYCIAESLKRPSAVNKAYNIAGASAYSLKEIVRIIAAVLGKRLITIPIPISIANAAARLAGALSRRASLQREQLLRLSENKSFDYSDATDDLDYRPMSFEEGIGKAIETMPDAADDPDQMPVI